jgi:spore coat protein U-like protein
MTTPVPARPCRRSIRLTALASLLLAHVASATCSLSVVGVNFGGYDFMSSQNLDSVGHVIVTCDTSSSFSISLSTGAGTYASRTMQNGAHLLHYNLYTDPAHTMVWGDGTGGSVVVSGSGTQVDEVVYGSAPAGQNPYLGTYGDAVTVTLTF